MPPVLLVSQIQKMFIDFIAQPSLKMATINKRMQVEQRIVGLF